MTFDAKTGQPDIVFVKRAERLPHERVAYETVSFFLCIVNFNF